MAYVLEAENICKSFGQANVLINTSFCLQHGEIHALVGENGAGKSTLIKIISGIYEKDSGTIKVEGSLVHFTSPKDALNAGIRVIHQEINIVPSLSVAENIYLGNYPKRKSGQIDWICLRSNAKQTLGKLGMEIDLTKKAGSLSIADQQMIEIAKALSVNPKILIMDEPTAALNDQETVQLFQVLNHLRTQGVAIIYITHRFAEIHQLANRVTVLRDGISVETLNLPGLTDDTLVKLMVGKEDSAIFKRTPMEIGDEIFRAEHLYSRGWFEDINLQIRRGEIVVLFGLMGAGQTQLLRAIFGDLSLDTGELYLNGESLQCKTIRDACKRGVGYVSDDRKNEGLIPLQSVQENICLAAYSHKLSNRMGIISYKKAAALAQSYYERLQIHCSGIRQKIGALSGGNQQKGMICRWLANDARLLLLNMPTRGVDVGARAEIYKTMETLASEGCALLTVSLEIPEVLSIADTVYVMHEGKITGRLDKTTMTQENLMRCALGLQPNVSVQA